MAKADIKKDIKMPDNVTIKGRKFVFKIPNAWDGCAIFNMLCTFELPFGLSNVVGLKSFKRPLNPAELEQLMKLCLTYCYEKISTSETNEPNYAQVVDSDGQIGIIGGESAPLLTKIFCQYINFFMDRWRREAI